MLAIKKVVSRYFSSNYKLLAFLLSTFLSFPLALVASILWFTILEREYSFRNLAYAAPFDFIFLIGIIWFITKKFLVNVNSLVSHVSWKHILSMVVSLVLLIAGTCFVWMNLGNVIFNPPLFKHKVDISPLNNSTGEICILEIVNDEGVKINKENNNIFEVLSTGAWVSQKNDCQFFFPGSSMGSLNFNYIAPVDDELTFRVKRNEDTGEFLIRVNGVKAAFFGLPHQDAEHNTLYHLPLNHGAGMIAWNMIRTAGLAAVIVVLLMIMFRNHDYVVAWNSNKKSFSSTNFLLSRKKILLACCLAVLVFARLFTLFGYNNTWGLWNIPTMPPYFADLRSITHGADSYAQGFDPMIENPGDPLQRRLNYPRIWQSLYSIGVNQSHTKYIGIVIILLFLIGVCLVLPHASNTMILLVMAAVLSPATLLGVERGNVDLFMFFLAAVSVVAAQSQYILSAVIILFGFVLKLYPIFGCAVFLKLYRSKFLKHMIIISIISTLYAFITFSDLLLIMEGTPKGAWLSYGLNTFWERAMILNDTRGVYLKYFSYLAVLLTMGIAFSAMLRNDFLPGKQNYAVYFDAFRSGAAIYMGTFLLGNNWDYRLMFLILAIPQLVVWAKCPARNISAISKVVMSAVFLSLWHLMIVRVTSCLPYGGDVSFVLDDISTWVVFSGLMYLFFWSMPDWVKRYARSILSLTRRSA